MKSRVINTFLILIATAMATGCANGYRDFYTPNDAVIPSTLELLNPEQQPILYESNDFNPDIENLVSKNFVIIGESKFNGKIHSKEQLLDQAKRIRATHVIYGARFVTNQITSTPIFLPNGFGGINSTTISGQHMRYDQGAIFFARSNKKPRFGVLPNELTPEKRKTIGTNKGVLVRVVLEDSPAFHANILKDDVITSINAKDISNVSQLASTLDSIPTEQETVTFELLRDGKPITATLKMKN